MGSSIFEVKISNQTVEVRVDTDDKRLSAPQLAIIEALKLLRLPTNCDISTATQDKYNASVKLKGKGETVTRYYKLSFEDREYSVTLVGKWTKTVRVQSGTVSNSSPQVAVIRALAEDTFYKNKKYKLVKEKEAPDVFVQLKNGQRASKTGYKIVMASEGTSVTNVTDSVSKKAMRMSLIDEFKSLAVKERNKYIKEVEEQCGNDGDKLLEWNDSYSRGRGLKREIKKGATAKECAKLWFDKQSTGFQEMIAQAQVFSDDFVDVNIKDKDSILKALNSSVCMVLAKKSGGGITGYICTTNLNLHSQIYEPNMWAKYKITDIYTPLFTFDTRKVDMFRKSLEQPPKDLKTKLPQVTVASCSIRLKERAKGGHEISSTEYSLVFENVIAMKAYVGVSKIPQTITATIAETVMTKGYDAVKELYNIEKLALQCAIATVNNNKIPTNLKDIVIENAMRKGVSEEDAIFYYDNKIQSITNAVNYALDKNTKGTLL